ncbi:unnamed protein product [Hymenolepis diminuta]|uniref:Uncharacterized protein n=1 Tax=Hymenolepis diminuta TaxID=6216 RepID=A0A564Y4G6_HYMDI|nr:unnamed protein product [Hymenolepis diminuta]
MNGPNKTKSNGVNNQNERRVELLNFTNYIQATSTNPICQILLTKLDEEYIVTLNKILTYSPIIRKLTVTGRCENLETNLFAISKHHQMSIIAWIVFWCDIVPVLINYFAPNSVKETMNFYVSGVRYVDLYRLLDMCFKAIRIQEKFDADYYRKRYYAKFRKKLHR